jgi:metallophosphoesterase (TIGR00282 family)
MRILFIGDIVGKPGRAAVAQVLPPLKKDEEIDLVVANVENLAHGKGLTKKTWAEMQRAGVDLGTSGNHVLSKDDARVILADPDTRVIRPANYPADTPGIGAKIFNIAGKKVLLINLIGTAFMANDPTSPFKKVEEILSSFPKYEVCIVDLHGEATSEKVAMGWYLDGRASLVVGSHTHVPTADARLLLHGTGYVTDLGMCGLRDGIIGVDREAIMPRFLEDKKLPHEIAEHGPVIFNSVLANVDGKGHATQILRLDRELEV